MKNVPRENFWGRQHTLARTVRAAIVSGTKGAIIVLMENSSYMAIA